MFCFEIHFLLLKINQEEKGNERQTEGKDIENEIVILLFIATNTR